MNIWNPSMGYYVPDPLRGAVAPPQVPPACQSCGLAYIANAVDAYGRVVSWSHGRTTSAPAAKAAQ